MLSSSAQTQHASAKQITLLEKDEILADDIVDFKGKLSEVKKEVEFLLAEWEAHGAPTLDLAIPFKDVGQQTKKVREWLLEKV